ncbi:hypothetical protein LTR94_028499, partial [Friedmanniomyces endolithicus]
RITVTGALMKVFDGPGMVADKADAPIIPVRIDGAQYTPFSRLRGKVRLRRFPKIRLTVDETLFEALLEARHIHGGKAPVVEDIKREPMTYDRLVIGSLALGKPLAAATRQGEAVGVLLPNVSAVVATFFALQAHGRVPAMLNYTAGLTNLKAACTAAQVRTIVTARAFITQAKLGDIVTALEAEGITILWLEDIGARIGTGAKLRAMIASRFAARSHKKLRIAPDAPAVILFTSGSEGLPKGVVLTHHNLLSNCRQLAARIDFNTADT